MFLGGCGGMLTFLHTLTKTSQRGHPSLAHKGFWWVLGGLTFLHTYAHTHTHLLRTIFANSDVECISRAKAIQLYLTGMGR